LALAMRSGPRESRLEDPYPATSTSSPEGIDWILGEELASRFAFGFLCLALVLEPHDAAIIAGEERRWIDQIQQASWDR
jgi:hypothetical protein